jgi:tRNA modification GTPase
VYIKDNLVLLIDTAGLRKAKDNVEKIGVEKSLEEIKKSDIVLIVDDKNPAIIYNKIKNRLKNKPYLLVCNKADINGDFSNDNSILISCTKKTGFTSLLTSLSTLINNRVDVFSKQHNSLINRRQKILLENVVAQLSRAADDFDANKDLVVCLSLLYDVLDSFNTLIRPINKDEILNDIFGGFCVGK